MVYSIGNEYDYGLFEFGDLGSLGWPANLNPTPVEGFSDRCTLSVMMLHLQSDECFLNLKSANRLLVPLKWGFRVHVNPGPRGHTLAG